jgi:hypothetical protein
MVGDMKDWDYVTGASAIALQGEVRVQRLRIVDRLGNL